MKNRLKVLLVDDHVILRDGLAAILQSQPSVEIVGGLGSGEELISDFDRYMPDIVIMDIMMGGMTGLEATRWIKEQHDVKVILMSSEITKEFVSTGIKVGIDGYLPKNVSKSVLIEAIEAVSAGQKYFNEAITNLIFEDFYKTKTGEKKKDRRLSGGLTDRETEVLALLSSGKSNQEAADLLFISIKTVETHKANILDKLGLKNTAEMVKYAIKHNIIEID